MDELVNQVVQKTGISQDQANQAVQTVINYLKGKLPGPIASQLDGLMSGQANPGGIAGQAGQALGGLGDMMGGNPDS